ncbi:MAG TPA: nitrogen fixation protein NifM [Lamprocystis sp. (in: g-proteobacteria)]|nr:nitrogen fixation protein NifM [Lamprocystis sp. (in: g-proteobacteria)]
MSVSPINALSPSGPSPQRAEYRYHRLRAAGERFQLGWWALDGSQRAEVERQARRTFDLEDLVLGSVEARAVVIPTEQVDGAVAELRGRYPDADAFAADLERNGLDLETLRGALRRELGFDAVMQLVGSRHAGVDELQDRLFYEVHRERFITPERRTARHILITVNDDFEENRRAAARARIEQIAQRLSGPVGGRVQRFESLARAHSECPTALEGGRLGEVVPGQLYPALDAALFALSAGETGGPVESEMGLHLLLCERIQPARCVPFAEVQPQIRRGIEERQRRNCQKAWINALRQRASAPAGQSNHQGKAA